MKSKTAKFKTFDIVVLSFAHFAHDVFTAFLSPILPILIEKYNLSLKQASFLDVIRGLPALLNPFIGWFVDKKGGKIFVIFGPTITAVLMSSLGLAPNYAFLILLLFLTGLNSTIFHVPVPVMVKEASGDKKGMGMSFFMIGGELARSVGPILVVAGITWWGLDGIWRLAIFGIVASTILFFRVRKITPQEKTKENKPKISVKSTLKRVYKFFLVMAGFMFFVSLLKASLTYFLPTYLKIKGNSLWMATNSLSILQFAGMFGAMYGGFLSDKIGRKKVLLLAWITVPVLTFLFLHASSWLAYLLLIFIGLTMYVTTPVLLAYVHDISCTRPAFINSLFMITNFGVNAVAKIIIGILGDKIGLEKTFLILTFTAFLTIPFIFMLKKPE